MQRADLCTFGSLQEPRRVGTWGMASVFSENQETAREENAKAADGQRQASHDGRLTQSLYDLQAESPSRQPLDT